MDRIAAEIRQVVDELSVRRQSVHYRMVAQAREYIDENFTRDIGLDEVAEHVGISAGYLSALFKQYAGENFTSYHTNCRICTAKKLLGDRTVKIYEIASRVGYYDVKYFNKIFKKVVGVTPSEYREHTACRAHSPASCAE
jgi:two-component system response regulator YesN